MHVTLDVSPTAQKHAGLGRYAGEIARALDQRADVNLNLFYNRHDDATLPDYLSHIPHQSVNIGNKPWRMGVLASHFVSWPMDRVFGTRQIFHATNHLLGHFRHAHTVYTLHDLIFLRYPEYHLFYNRVYLTQTMPRYLQAADLIITPSEHSKRDAMAFYTLPDDKIKVIYEAPAPIFQPTHSADRLAEVGQRYQLPEQFILHVGTIEPRKNLSRLLEAFWPLLDEWPDLRLVLIGKKGWLYDQFFQKLTDLGLDDHVILPGFVAEADLPVIYQLAELFVYPSLYEGFGLPPIEAMACGTPVVCSNRSSLPEVVGSAGLLIDPENVRALSLAMQVVLRDANMRQYLIHAGIEQSQRFSWQRAVDELVAAYMTIQ